MKYAGMCVLAVGVALVGCRTTAPTPALAPGFYTQQDQAVAEVLAGAKAAVLRYEADVAKKTYNPTPEMLRAVDAIEQALRVADPLALAWHNQLGTNPAAPEPAELARQVNVLESNTPAVPGATR